MHEKREANSNRPGPCAVVRLASSGRPTALARASKRRCVVPAAGDAPSPPQGRGAAPRDAGAAGEAGEEWREPGTTFAGSLDAGRTDKSPGCARCAAGAWLASCREYLVYPGRTPRRTLGCSFRSFALPHAAPGCFDTSGSKPAARGLRCITQMPPGSFPSAPPRVPRVGGTGRWPADKLQATASSERNSGATDYKGHR